MNLVVILPLVLAVMIALIIFNRRRHKTGGSGLDGREDSTERPELRGTEQWKDRH